MNHRRGGEMGGRGGMLGRRCCQGFGFSVLEPVEDTIFALLREGSGGSLGTPGWWVRKGPSATEGRVDGYDQWGRDKGLPMTFATTSQRVSRKLLMVGMGVHQVRRMELRWECCLCWASDAQMDPRKELAAHSELGRGPDP
jgi:hypothetical protein